VGHPIGVVARRTGVPPDLLRAWEKRYQAVVPVRTETGRRLYNDEDIQRLRLMKRLIEGKRRISDVARMSLAELTELLGEDVRETVSEHPEPAGHSETELGARLTACLEAVEALDPVRLEDLLHKATVAYSPSRVRRELLVPLMVGIGESWQSGKLRIIHEHMASAVVRSFLIASAQSQHNEPTAPLLVATTPAGQLHEIGILLAVATAQEVGWRALYLGPNLPAEEIAAAVRQAETDTLVLSLVYPVADPRVSAELRRIRQLVGPEVQILIGGRAVVSYRDVISEIGAQAVEGLQQLQDRLMRASAA
jgi:DNA-binding transcriptional MerR regulator/methylmalonyl-CoA mutase cobalamin-binding subunit